MNNILDRIVAVKQEEVAALKNKFSYSNFESSYYFNRPAISLKERIHENFGIIAEIKRKSPSAGEINSEIDVITQGLKYDKSGASAISCLTDKTFFGGSIDDLKKLKEHVSIPVLRKEFIIDEIQLFESKAAGADVILLIAEILTKEEALHLTIIAQSLGLEVIMECHSRKEMKKINHLVDIVGINNRDLKLQKTDIQTSIDLFELIPDNTTCITESGIKSKDELEKLMSIGYHGALIGESILHQEDPKAFIESLQPKVIL
ncbi:MAG: indole-3-glycerol phosphate synthase TrpC [Crocinitomicaceae bacterium]|nr:indole-3-glycerol phosphate synthase TrpC [Crocinitomicaceae bacterium]